jgi:hypothetical protein
VPAEAIGGQSAIRQTDVTGRVEFRSAPDGDVDLSTWTSSFALNEMVAPENGDFVLDLVAACLRERNGIANLLVTDASLRPDDQNDSFTQIERYAVPNARFVPGDRVNCTISHAPPVDVLVAPLPTTTIPEPTATLPATATTSTTTLAPVSPPLGGFLRADPDLTEAAAPLERFGLLGELEVSTDRFTLFVPDNDAVMVLKDSGSSPISTTTGWFEGCSKRTW